MVDQQQLNMMNGSQPAIDKNALREALGTDEPATLVTLYMSFLETSTVDLEKIKLAEADKDSAQLAELGHKLKSSARTVGANSLADCCEELEKRGELGDMTAIQQLLPQMIDIFKQIQAWIEHYRLSTC